MFCKYCGYEYQNEDTKFCPKCGKNLVDDEANNTQTDANEEVATTTVIDNNSNTGASKSLGGKFGIIVGLVILSVITVGGILISSKPSKKTIKDNDIFNTSNTPEPTYYESSESNDENYDNADSSYENEPEENYSDYEDNPTYEEEGYYDARHDKYDYYEYDVDAIIKAGLKKIKTTFNVLESANMIAAEIKYPKVEECAATYEALVFESLSSYTMYGEFIVTIPVSLEFYNIEEKQLDLSIPVLELNQIETSPDDIDMAIKENKLIIVCPFWGVATNENRADTENIEVLNSRDELMRCIGEDLTIRVEELNPESSKEFNEEYDNTYQYNSLLGMHLYYLQCNIQDLDERGYKAQSVSAFFNYLEMNYDWISEAYPKLCREYASDDYDEDDY